MIKEKWVKLNAYGVIKNSLELITKQKETHENYFTKTLTRWSNRVNYGNGELTSELNSYRTQGQAADYLYRWLYKRYNYLSTQWSDGRDVLTGFLPAQVNENLPANSKPYRFEAENAVLANGIDAGSIRSGRDGASNGGYVGDLSGGAGKTLTFHIDSEKSTTVYLFACVSKRAGEASFDSWFTVTVNGTQLSLPNRTVSAVSGGEQEWHTFVSVKLMPFKLNKGENVIVFTTCGDSTNFDYIELYSAVTLK